VQPLCGPAQSAMGTKISLFVQLELGSMCALCCIVQLCCWRSATVSRCQYLNAINKRMWPSSGREENVESMHATIWPCPLVSCFLFNANLYMMWGCFNIVVLNSLVAPRSPDTVWFCFVGCEKHNLGGFNNKCGYRSLIRMRLVHVSFLL